MAVPPGIEATGYVRGGKENLRLDTGPGAYVIDRWRQRLRDRIEAILPDTTGETRVLGDRSGLDPEQWKVLTRTGTSHLIAISGLHVDLVAAFLFFLSRWAWSRGTRLPRIIAAPRTGALAALAGTAAYRPWSCWRWFWGPYCPRAPSVRRAASSWPWPGCSSWTPKAVLAYGFWLSFGVLAAFGQRLGMGGLWDRWGKAQWVVALGLLPLLLLLFGRAPLIAPLVNLVAAPLFGLVLLPVVLAASLLAWRPDGSCRWF